MGFPDTQAHLPSALHACPDPTQQPTPREGKESGRPWQQPRGSTQAALSRRYFPTCWPLRVGLERVVAGTHEKQLRPARGIDRSMDGWVDRWRVGSKVRQLESCLPSNLGLALFE